MKTNQHWILDDKGEPIKADLMTWATWFEDFDKRRVAVDYVGDIKVSTVFLGLDHNYSEDGPPILWETMVFGGSMDEHQERCSGSREQAEAMHQSVLNAVKESLNLKENLDYQNGKDTNASD